MAYWFHRNPLKATAPITFELRGAATNGQAQKICRLVGRQNISLHSSL